MKKRQKLNSSLPQDVMIEILMRLPFESILALKRVSKQWKDLINDPSFFNRYGDKSLAVVRSKDGGLYGLLLRHGKNKKIPVTVNGCRHPPFTMCPITIGSSNPPYAKRWWSTVVLCNWMTYAVTLSGDFHLYNVLTGASYTVTDSPIREYPYWGVCHGFGYDRYEDDYKILVVCDPGNKDYMIFHKVITFGQEGEEDNGLFWVYSLRSRVWKRLEGSPYTAYAWCISLSSKTCSLNGVLHWGVATRKDPSKPVIVTYDLHTCRFGEILVPDGYNALYATVGELGGQLCCWKFNDGFEVWVMKEYGVRESWTLLCRIDDSTLGRCRQSKCWMEPAALYECQDGRKWLLLVYRGSLFWYDIHNDEMKVIDEKTWRKRRGIGGSGNKKSLIVAKNYLLKRRYIERDID